MNKKNEHKKHLVHVVWAESISKKECKRLRTYVEEARRGKVDSIILNYEVHWDIIEVDPKGTRLVYSEVLQGKPELEELRKQVERAIADPNYTVVTNYQVTWIEILRRRRHHRGHREEPLTTDHWRS